MKKKDETVLASIFSENRKKILLVKRRDVPVWVLPGGGVEENENEEDAILREAKEEYQQQPILVAQHYLMEHFQTVGQSYYR